MSKTKKQIIFFIIIVLIGVGYTINEYIIAPQKLLNQQKENKSKQISKNLNC